MILEELYTKLLKRSNMNPEYEAIKRNVNIVRNLITEVQTDELATWRQEDQSTLKNGLSQYGTIQKVDNPEVKEGTAGKIVTWAVTINDSNGAEIQVIFTTSDPMNFNITTVGYKVTKDTFPLLMAIRAYKEKWQEEWDIRLKPDQPA
ncbi:MAG TPA: hypothetical protein VMZ91_15920 [Candidatus Paceibacterota bacterium]|nr:hypothetical protein [Candidatus Paceibacterota bacterium]